MVLPKRENGAGATSLLGPTGHSVKYSFDLDEGFYCSGRFKVILRRPDRDRHSLLQLSKPSAAEGAEKATVQIERSETWWNFHWMTAVISDWRQICCDRKRFQKTDWFDCTVSQMLAFKLQYIPDSLSLELDCCEKERYK